MTENKSSASSEKPPYNLDPSVFKSLSELMGQRKAKFLDLQKLLADKDKPRPFWKVLRDARKTAEYAEDFIKKHELIESACASRAKSIPKDATSLAIVNLRDRHGIDHNVIEIWEPSSNLPLRHPTTCPKCKKPGTVSRDKSNTDKNGFFVIRYLHPIGQKLYVDVETGQIIYRQTVRKMCYIGKAINLNTAIKRNLLLSQQQQQQQRKKKKQQQYNPVRMICPRCNNEGRIGRIHKKGKDSETWRYYINHGRVEGMKKKVICYILEQQQQELVSKTLGR